MKDRTLVYMTFRDGAVSLRTVSRSRKSPHRFYISCQELERLETGSTALVQDVHSFAKLRWDAYAGTIEVASPGLRAMGTLFPATRKPLPFPMAN